MSMKLKERFVICLEIVTYAFFVKWIYESWLFTGHLMLSDGLIKDGMIKYIIA